MAFRGAVTTANATGGPTTVTVTGIGIQLNDIVLLALSHFIGNTLTWPSGFVQVPGTSPAVNDGNVEHIVFYKVATSTEVAASTLSVSGTQFGSALTCRVYSGRNTSSPFSAVQQTAHGTAAAFPLTFSITGLSAVAGDDVVVFVAEQNTGGSTACTLSYTPSSGFTNGFLANDTVDNNAYWMASSDIINTSGATGTIAGTLSVTSGAGPGQSGYLAQVISVASVPIVIPFPLFGQILM